MNHTCHWPGCPVEVPPKMWGCKAHWFMLPRALRNRIWASYRPGQEIDKRPSQAYLDAAAAVQRYIRDNSAAKAPRAPTPKAMKATTAMTEPDWSGKCESCGASPIVPLTGMCGPCTFGEAGTAGGEW